MGTRTISNTGWDKEAVQPARNRRTVLINTKKQENVSNAVDLEEALSAFFLANKAANAAGREATAKKSALHNAMVHAGVKEVTTIVEDGDTRLPVEAKISSEMKSMISVKKLRELVDEDTFMKIISATKTKVTAVAGTNICIATTVEVLGKEDLHVSEVKG